MGMLFSNRPFFSEYYLMCLAPIWNKRLPRKINLKSCQTFLLLRKISGPQSFDVGRTLAHIVFIWSDVKGLMSNYPEYGKEVYPAQHCIFHCVEIFLQNVDATPNILMSSCSFFKIDVAFCSPSRHGEPDPDPAPC